MKTQNTMTIAIPPPTPSTNSSNGIASARSFTDTSYSFSCTFSSKLHKKVRACIKEAFPKYSKDFLNKVFKKEVSGQYEYMIALKEMELKLEYRLVSKDKKSKKQQKVVKRFHTLENAIINL